MHRPVDALATLAVLLAVALLAASPAPARADNASTFRDAIPRYGGKSDFDPEDEDYQMSVAVLAVVPVVFAVGTLVACVVACCCKTLCRCCCRRDNDENGPPQFTQKQRWVPLVALGVLAVGCMAFSAAGIAESGKLTDTLLAKPVDENDTETLSVRSLVPNSIRRIQGRVQKVRAPVEAVETVFESVVDSVSALLLGISADLGVGLTDLSDELAGFSDTYASVPGLNASASPDGRAWSCLSCSQVSDRVGEASADLGTAATDTVEQMNEVNTKFRDEISNQREEVLSNVRDLESTMREADDNLGKAENTTDDIVELLEDWDPTRHAVTVGVFAVPIVALALAFVGALLRIGTCFKVNMWTYYLVVFLCWLLFAVHLPLAVVLSDSCAYVEEYEEDTVRVKGAVANATLTDDPDETRIFQAAVACLDDLGLVDKLGYGDRLDFSEQVPRPTFGNVSEQFDLDGIAELGQLVQDMTTNSTVSFGFVYEAEVNAPWRALKDDGTLTSPELVNSASDFLSYTGGSSNATLVGEVQDAVNRSVQTHDLLLGQLANMSSDFDALEAKQEEVRDRTVASADTVSNVTEQLNPLFDLADEVVAEARCPEARDAYEDSKTLFCDSVSRHLTTIAMSLFFIAFLGWFVIWLSAKNAKRWPNKAAKVIDGDEENYDGMPMKKLDSTPASPRSANPPTYASEAAPPSAPAYNANPQEGGAQY